MAKIETHFIPQNKLISDYIDVYNGETLVGKIKAGAAKMPELGNKLYSFGALSDVHVTYGDLARTRFKNAIKFLSIQKINAEVEISRKYKP